MKVTGGHWRAMSPFLPPGERTRSSKLNHERPIRNQLEPRRTSMDDKGWTKYYRAAHEAGTDLAYPSETLVRLFRGNYIKGMPKIYQGMSVLDVGCGSGNNMLFLASLGMRVSGVETSDEMCAAARGKLAAFGFEADVQVGDNRNLPFSSNSFHFLVSWNVLH